ncbi:MAG: hypothetical protein LUI02_01085 [Clostridiales bacterium]|nr:hypothetical protein [Clostridiales bacterium]
MSSVISVGSLIGSIAGGSVGVQSQSGSASASQSSSGATGKSGSSSISANASAYLPEDDIDKAENDRLLLQSQLASTKLDAMGAYFGALQTAVKESGSDGIQMYRRITKLTDTESAYKQTDNYKNKKDTDAFVGDQVNSLKEKQEEIAEAKEKRTEKAEQIEKIRESAAERTEEIEERQEAAAERAKEADEFRENISDNKADGVINLNRGDEQQEHPVTQDMAKRTAETYRAGAEAFRRERESTAGNEDAVGVSGGINVEV